MSRSYKKNPIIKDKDRQHQTLSNRKARRMNKVLPSFYEDVDGRRGKHEVIANGKQHRKVYSQYKVIERTSFYSKEMWEGEVEASAKAVANGDACQDTPLDENKWRMFYLMK